VTRQEFVDRVAAKSGLSRRDASKAVDAFLDSVTEALKRGDSVAFTGFGKFSTAQRASRMGLREAAAELREEAEELGRDHKTFRESIERSQQTLKEIAGVS